MQRCMLKTGVFVWLKNASSASYLVLNQGDVLKSTCGYSQYIEPDPVKDERIIYNFFKFNKSSLENSFNKSFVFFLTYRIGTGITV